MEKPIVLVIMDGVGKAFGEKRIFSGATLTVERGNKIAFVGRNGEGKSTLVKCIMKELEHEGKKSSGFSTKCMVLSMKLPF